QQEPNRLIREFLDPKRMPTKEEIRKILDHVARAPFSTRPVKVEDELVGKTFLGRELRGKESSIIAHLAKRVLLEEQWSGSTTPDQYLDDLHGAIRDPDLRRVVYRGKDGIVNVGFLAPNKLLPEKLGKNSRPYIWVIYAADHGTIRSGYQVSGVEAISLPEKARWL
ncbi:MAG: hypothetical protein M1587_03000, partial [Thaumarchaeota archaeon]|nr:hypothetical protein [Nitrososphaerota archaeon]